MKKRIYRLSDIEKILTFIPPVFILILAIATFILGMTIIDHRQNSEIALITQTKALQKHFEQKNFLNTFIEKVDKKLQTELINQEVILKEHTHTLKGLSLGISSISSLTIVTLKNYLETTQIQNDIKFVIFDEEYNLHYGKDTISNIQNLIFNNKTDEQLLQITLMYIASQGKNSTFRWKNDLDKTIQLSYFEKLPNSSWYIGAFSSIDSLKLLTKRILHSEISSSTFNTFYLWFYDNETKRIYNYQNKKRWQISSLPTQKNLQHTYERYFLKIGVLPLLNDIEQEKEMIHKKYRDIRTVIFSTLLISTFILIASTTIFANFIKKIFSSYNKRMEKKNRLLSLLKERFELAVIASNDGLWDTNFNTNKTFFSQKWLDILGYKPGDISSYEEWFKLLHKDDKARVNQELNAHMNGEKDHLICEYRLKTKDNKYKWVLARGKVFLNKSCSPKRLLMMSMDIDDAKKLEKNIKDTELLVSDGDIVFLRLKHIPSFSVMFISDSINTYGYNKKQFLENKLTYLDIIHPDDKDEFLASLHAHINKGFADYTKSYRIITKGSEIKWVFNRMIFVKDDFGHINNFYGYIYDITALKQSEIELENRVKLEVEKNQEKQKLLIQQNKLAAMGEMIGSIAHQWRQPLNNISLILHFLKDNYKAVDEKKIDSYVNNAKEQLDYMSNTIDDFRNFYKPSKQKELFNVLESIKASISILKTPLEKYSISLHIDSNSFQVNGYENEFKQAILNILSNAIDAIKHIKDTKGIIYIKISDRSIEIRNNGGIATQEVLERMFEPYFTTKFEDKGTGIGLYMSKTIIESMKGKIDATNTDDGVKFIIVF